MVACYTRLYDRTSTGRRYCWDNDIKVTNAVNPLVYIETLEKIRPKFNIYRYDFVSIESLQLAGLRSPTATLPIPAK